MMKLVNVVLREIKEKKEQIAHAIANGSAKDYGDYKGLCGEIRGLSAVELYLQDLAHNLEQDDD